MRRRKTALETSSNVGVMTHIHLRLLMYMPREPSVRLPNGWVIGAGEVHAAVDSGGGI